MNRMKVIIDNNVIVNASILTDKRIKSIERKQSKYSEILVIYFTDNTSIEVTPEYNCMSEYSSINVEYIQEET